MTTQSPTYLDIQAEVGITKHLGGFTATDELLALCHVADANEVLYVGAGIGVGPAYIARKFGCRVVAVDISEKMLAWTAQRACEEDVAQKVETRLANILDLPFDDNRFDSVIVESVAAFVEDKAKAVQECRRVTRSGGFVGFNEVFWTEQPSKETLEAYRRIQMSECLILLKEWQTLWDTSGLQERTIRTYQIVLQREIKDRMQWAGSPLANTRGGTVDPPVSHQPGRPKDNKRADERDIGFLPADGLRSVHREQINQQRFQLFSDCMLYTYRHGPHPHLSRSRPG